jgi:hypothetical protein
MPADAKPPRVRNVGRRRATAPKGEPMNAQIRPFQLTAPGPNEDALDAIIVELASIERRLARLRDKQLRERLEADDDAIWPDELERHLQDRRDAARAMASHSQAKTREGVILQALITLGTVLPAMWDQVPSDCGKTPEQARYRELEAQARRMLYSIVYSDEDISDDLRLLRDTLAPRRWHALAAIEEIDRVVPLQAVRS